MQTQNSAEREKPKKGRQNPAPPAGSKAGGLGIAKEFINFLLEHDVFQFTFLGSAKLLERCRYDAFATEEEVRAFLRFSGLASYALRGKTADSRKVFLQPGCLLNSEGTSICSRPR